MTVEKDVYQIDTSDAIANVKKLDEELSGLYKDSENAKSSFEEMSELFSKDVRSAIFSAEAAYNALSSSVKAATEFVIEGAKAFLEAEQAQMRLNVALQNAGGYSANLTSKLNEQNSAIQRLTGIDDDYLTGLQAMLTTMGVAPEMLGRFTQAAVNLSIATGQDARVAAVQLARANAEGRDELAKYGIQVDETAFAARGFAAVLDEVDRRYSNMAEQQPEIIRSTNELKGAWSDFQEAVGEAAIKMVSFGSAGKPVVSLLDTMTERLKNANIEGVHFKNIMATMFPVFAPLAGIATLNDLFGNAPDAKPVSTEPDFSPAPASHLPGFEPPGSKKAKEKEDARKKALDKARADYKKYREDMEALSINSHANLDKLEDEANAKMMERIKAQGDWELQAEELRVKENAQLAEDNIAILKSMEEERQKLADERLAKEKAHWEEMRSTFESYAQTLVSSQISFLGQMLTENTAYNRAVFEMELQKRTVGMAEADVAKERVKLEKELADERAAAYLKMTADALASIAQQSAVKAVLEGVEAIASLAVGNAAGAALHGAAAAGYAGVAALAGGGAALLSSTRGMTSDEKSQLKSAEQSKKDKAAGKSGDLGAGTVDGPKPPGTQVNVYYLGISGVTEAEQGRELERIRSQYSDMKTGGR